MSSADDPLDRLEQGAASQSASRRLFHEQLGAVDAGLVAAASIVADLITPVTAAFLDGDRAAAAQAVAADADVDRRCELLEERCFVLLARQSPVAGDLRRVIATVRCITDVSRAGDLLRHVGESLSWVHPPSIRPELSAMIGRMGAVSAEIFSGAVRAWRERDALAAVDLQRLDDDVDLLQKRVLTELHLGGQSVEEAVSLALICRYYERIADHGVEISRQVAYAVTGDRPAGG